MLNIHEHPHLTRRQLLKIGGLGLAGLSLADLFAAKSAAAPSASPLAGKSVIFLFQQGGPSQFETFDPKPDASSDIRTITGVTQTSVPGLYFGDTLEQLSRLADKLTIVRSVQTGNAEHNIRPIVGPDSWPAAVE